MPLCLGIDFEHIYHTPAYRSLGGTPTISIDLEEITARLLRLLDQYDARATFFVVTDIAKEYPELIRRIANQGHEIASHTVTHPSLPSLKTPEKQAEIRDSKRELEAISGTTVDGFRAPTFQVDDEVYSLLAETGYEYSSSVVGSIPIPGFYSNEYSFRDPTKITTPVGNLVELPVTVNPWFRLPVSGAWTRLLGRRYTMSAVRAFLDRDVPVLTYAHPWEFSSLSETELPFRNRFRTGEWLFETYERLLALEADCLPVGELVSDERPKANYSTSQP